MRKLLYRLILWVQRMRRCVIIARNGLWQLWHGFPLDLTWSLYGLPLVFQAGRFMRFFDGRCTSAIRIGHSFKAVSVSGQNSLGVIQKVLLRTFAYGARLEIGDNVGMSGCSICASDRVRIGNNVLIGTGVLITDSDLHPLSPQARATGGRAKTMPVDIGDNVFIGARAIILKGVRIGDGSVIGAGAVVTHSVPAGVVAAGNPAKVVGEVK